jgi:hypothetical protein
MISFTIQPGFFSTRGLLGELLGRVDSSCEFGATCCLLSSPGHVQVNVEVAIS